VAISFVDSASAGSAANTDTTLTLPGTLADDDLVIVAYAIGDNDSVDQNVAMVTGGYTEVADLFGNSAGTQDVSFGVYYKFFAPGDSNPVCDALAAGTDAAVIACLMAFRGVAQVADGGPFEVTSTTNTGTGFNADPPSISGFTEATNWVVIAGASGNLIHATGITAGAVYTNPTNYTTNPVSRGWGDTSDVSVGMGYHSAPGDPEDPGVMTHTGTDDTTNYNWCAVTMVLKEAAAAAESAQFHTSYRSIYTGPTTD
jgi:hypothetical protein